MGLVKCFYLNALHYRTCTVLIFPWSIQNIYFYVGYEPLSWTSRERIALDSARGLEYIHEHTIPVYVHRDIKSANILIDKDLRAKVETFMKTTHVLVILCAIYQWCLAGCRFWTHKACRNRNRITVTSNTSCWYIWLHASRVSAHCSEYCVSLFFYSVCMNVHTMKISQHSFTDYCLLSNLYISVLYQRLIWLTGMLDMERLLLKWMSMLLVSYCMNLFQPKKLLWDQQNSLIQQAWFVW
jgi:serine/threonine protein kinase